MKKLLSKSILFGIFVLSSFANLHAGTKSLMAMPDHPHNVKLNLFAVGMRNLSLQYEFAFHKNLSVALGGRVMLPYNFDLGKQLQSDDVSSTGAELGKFKFTGYAITPEFRFYPGKKVEHQAPHGFYIAPYARISNFAINTSITIPSDTAVGFVGGPVDTEISYGGFGGGLMFGAQWILKNRISIDWWIAGLHYGSSKLKITATGDLIAQTGGATEVKGSLDELVEGDLPFNATSNVLIGGNSVSGNVNGIPFGGFRCGLCIGYNF
jgi:hypothetical protein